VRANVPFRQVQRAARIALAVTIATAVACSRLAPRRAPSIDAAAEAYVRIVLGLADRDEDSLDGYHGPASWRADARARHAPLEAVRADAVALRAALSDAAGTDRPEAAARRAFLIRQLDAVAARIDIVRGSRPPFAAEARVLFGLAVAEDAHAAARRSARADNRAELERLLPGSGDLATRYAAFDARFRVAPERLPQVVDRALTACRAATLSHIPLPSGERVEIVYRPDLAWSAFTRYQGGLMSRIEINQSFGLTVDRILDLACHEAYPGHHTIDTLIDARFGTRRAELLVRPLYSPQALLHEAAASVAPTFAFSEPQRIEVERDLLSLAGLDPAEAVRYVRVERLVDGLHDVEADITRRYLDGDLDFPRAAAALEHDALMPSADATLRFVNRFRSYAATYTMGRDRFAAAVAGQWTAYVALVSGDAQTLPDAARGR
jgi:hypothetical protein